EAAEGQGLGRDVAVLHNTLAYVLYPIEGPRASLAVLREGVAFAERRGVEEVVSVLKTDILEALVELGSYDEASALCGELLPGLEREEAMWDLTWVRITQARILTRRGRYAEAAPLAEWTAEQARESGEPQHMSRSMPVCALVRLALGDPAGAAAVL